MLHACLVCLPLLHCSPCAAKLNTPAAHLTLQALRCTATHPCRCSTPPSTSRPQQKVGTACQWRHVAPGIIRPVAEAAIDMLTAAESPPSSATAAAPGYSPFAGAAEPDSESPPYGASPSGGDGAAAGGAAWPADLQPPVASGAAGWAAEKLTQHGSGQALSSIGQQQQQPAQQLRPATLPRPISTDSLGRVASLAHGMLPGIPRVRTRPEVM